MKAILSNMGFIMQMSGIFILIPIIISFIYGESSATIALFITATTFFSFGFLLNSFCERKALNFKESSSLIFLAFVMLSVIGAIPYVYINASGQSNYLKLITDSVFESASGFTTTGFSVIPDLSIIPKSILFYRSLTQFIGGIGVVLILLAFFYPDEKLQEFSRSMGIPGNKKIKKTFFLILIVYVLVTIVLAGIGSLLGFKDIIMLFSYIFGAMSSGGFAPVSDISGAARSIPLNFILIICMILGASNFMILAGLFRLKIREFLRSEVAVFLVIAAIVTISIKVAFQFSFFDSLFHVISAMSTTGFQYLNLQNFTPNLKMLFVGLMFVGGASFSTAGGIKIFRLLLIYKATRKTVADAITKKNDPIRLFGKEYSNDEVIQALVVVILFSGIIFISSGILSAYGFDSIDSIFEATSAISGTGLSVGIVGASLVMELKWLFVALMLLGRVEILAFLIMLSRKREQ